MKIKLFVMLLVAMLLAGPASGASLPVTFSTPISTSGFDAFVLVESFETSLSGSSTVNTQSSQTGVLTDVPVPAAAWLFMSGLVGLIGISRRSRKPRQPSQSH